MIEFLQLNDLEFRIAIYVEAVGGEATLSQADIVRECNIARATLTRRINSLDFKGLLKATPTADGKFKFKLITEIPKQRQETCINNPDEINMKLDKILGFISNNQQIVQINAQSLIQKTNLEPIVNPEVNQLMEAYKTKYQEVHNSPYNPKQADYKKIEGLIGQYGTENTEHILTTFIQQYKSLYSDSKYPYPTVNMIQERQAKKALERYNELHRWDNSKNYPEDLEW